MAVSRYSLIVTRMVLGHNNYHHNTMLMTVSTRDIALQFARSETTIIIGKSSYRLDLAKKGRVVMGATLQPSTVAERISRGGGSGA